MRAEMEQGPLERENRNKGTLSVPQALCEGKGLGLARLTFISCNYLSKLLLYVAMSTYEINPMA